MTGVLDETTMGTMRYRLYDPGAGTWGMAVMCERAAAVGGAMRVEFPGRGTRIVVEVAT